MGSITPDEDDLTKRKMSIWLAWTPYVIVAVLLVMTRTIDPLTSSSGPVGAIYTVEGIFGTTLVQGSSSSTCRASCSS
jgi:lactate permease